MQRQHQGTDRQLCILPPGQSTCTRSRHPPGAGSGPTDLENTLSNQCKKSRCSSKSRLFNWFLTHNFKFHPSFFFFLFLFSSRLNSSPQNAMDRPKTWCSRTQRRSWCHCPHRRTPTCTWAPSTWAPSVPSRPVSSARHPTNHPTSTFIYFFPFTRADVQSLRRAVLLCRNDVGLCIQPHQMVCSGQYRGIQVWHVEHQQHGGWCQCDWVPVCPHSGRLPEDDYGKPRKKSSAVFCRVGLAPEDLSSSPSRSARRPMPWLSMEDRCSQLESAVWFLQWWSSMTRVWACKTFDTIQFF